MLSALRVASPTPSSEPKTKLKSVLGFAASGTPKDLDRLPGSLASNGNGRLTQSYSRRSVDTVSSYQAQRSTKGDRSSVAESLLFEDDAVEIARAADVPGSMKNGIAPRSMPSRRIPQRGDKQEGLWSISVAETPHDATSYSLYIKTPTHNLTLTRTAAEIVEVDGKLREALPGIKLPKLPLDPAKLPSPPKKKGNFLNTLSRLASPSSKGSSIRQVSLSRPSTATAQSSARTSEASTPIASPSQELGDPFSSFAADALRAVGANGQSPLHANSTVTGLAAYLTTCANDSGVRQTRVWKRFVRVRTDDLQSARPERAIKRVRSDLAAHSSPGSSTEVPRSMAQVLDDAEKSAAEEQTADANADADEDLDGTVEAVPVHNGVGEEAPVPEDDKAPAEPAEESSVTDEQEQPEQPQPAGEAAEALAEDPTAASDTVDNAEDVNGRSTPTASTASEPPSSRGSHIHRSQSADPMSRTSRMYSSTSAVSTTLRGSSSQASMTGDDSSISTTGRRSTRKKRSKSVDPSQLSEKKKSKRKVVIDDFELVRVLGKGCAGKVLLVRHKPTSGVYALKAITKRHVLAHQELQHTLTEQAVLKRMAAGGTDPFVVRLWWSFHDKEYLYLVMDFHPGGDLATQLARLGRLGRDRARFYAVEIVEGVEGLHAAGVIYRDLKPENILIAADGHIVLTDFGLSKEFPRRTSAITAPPTPSGSRNEFLDGYGQTASPPWMDETKERLSTPWAGANDTTSTFCGTAEYLAPEVIQGLPYSYEVDWWSFGTMLYEMLVGITPFWADNHSDMYYRVLQDELVFPEEIHIDRDTRSLIRGLLQRNPALRMKEPRIKKHPYFSMIDWSHVYHKRYIPPFVPPIDPSNAGDTQNFDDTYLEMEPVIADEADDSNAENDPQTDGERTDGEDSIATPSQSRSPSVHPAADDDSVDVFDGYSFKGRHSVILDDEDEEGDGDESGEDEEDEEDEESQDEEFSYSQSQRESEGAVSEMETVDEVPEPATPEAKPHGLPEEEEASQAALETPVDAKPAVLPEPEAVNGTTDEVDAELKEQPATPIASEPAPATAPEPEPAASSPVPAAVPAPAPVRQETIVVKAPVPRPAAKGRNRREKSGIPALDRNIADTNDEEEATGEREEDDEDWDFVETNVNEERNGAKGAGLFTRGGVVDRYRLTVFRKSTPRRTSGRNFSTSTMMSDLPSPGDLSQSPTPSDKQRRGRNPGLTFKRNPKEFLRQRSPPPSLSSSKSRIQQALSAASTSSSTGPITPSPSQSSATPMSPSLKSKESAVSMGSPSESSDQSVNGDAQRGASLVSIEEKQQKSKVLKKYKEGAEKVLSIFQSPR